MEKQLPKNWVETSPKEISKLLRGVSYGKTDAYQEEFENSCLILRGGNIQDGKIVDGNDNVYVDLSLIKEDQLLQEADVVIVGSTGSKQLIGKAATSLKSFENVSFGAFLMAIRANENLNKWFFSYYFQTDFYRESIRNLAGGVNINNIRKEYIENLYFPLPPLAEQNRIVEKLDALFAQLETIKTSMAKVPLLLKDFRQQVLTQAVTGKLKPFKKFEVVKLNDLGIWKGGGTPSKANSSFWENGTILWTTAKDMKDLFLSDSMDKITESAVKGSSAILIPKNSILIVTRSGILRRILPISSNTVETTVNQDLKVLIPSNKANYKFLLYALRGLEQDIRTTCMKSGTTVESVEFPLLKNYKINLPSLEEQQEIVSRVESLFAKADAIEKQYESLKAKINSLPQAILHKAFKGELTEQLDSDGDARELLREIEMLKQVQQDKSKKGKSKTTKSVAKTV